MYSAILKRVYCSKPIDFIRFGMGITVSDCIINFVCVSGIV